MMQAYRIETTMIKDGELLLRELPLKAGELVEIIILAREPANGKGLNGTPSTNGASIESAQLTEEKRKRRLEALDRISSGKYAHKTDSGLLPSEEFSLRKAEEKALEERRWK